MIVLFYIAQNIKYIFTEFLNDDLPKLPNRKPRKFSNDDYRTKLYETRTFKRSHNIYQNGPLSNPSASIPERSGSYTLLHTHTHKHLLTYKADMHVRRIDLIDVSRILLYSRVFPVGCVSAIVCFVRGSFRCGIDYRNVKTSSQCSPPQAVSISVSCPLQ